MLLLPKTVGPFTLLRRLGADGVAERDEPVGQVAHPVIRSLIGMGESIAFDRPDRGGPRDGAGQVVESLLLTPGQPVPGFEAAGAGGAAGCSCASGMGPPSVAYSGCDDARIRPVDRTGITQHISDKLFRCFEVIHFIITF